MPKDVKNDSRKRKVNQEKMAEVKFSVHKLYRKTQETGRQSVLMKKLSIAKCAKFRGKNCKFFFQKIEQKIEQKLGKYLGKNYKED